MNLAIRIRTARSRVTVCFLPRSLFEHKTDFAAVSRVKCNNCKQMGHYKSLCTNPFVPDKADDGGYGGGDSYDFRAAEDPNFHNNDTSAANVSIGGADDW